MSAQLSSTASKSLSPDKNALKLPPLLRDLDCDFAKHDESADQSNGQGETAPTGDRTDASPLDSAAQFQPSLSLLVVDESSQVRQMCSEVAESFGFVGTEAKTIRSARETLERQDKAVLVIDLTRAENEGRSFLAHPRQLTHIHELDGVRGIAALMVFCHHVCSSTIDPTGWGASVRFLAAISLQGASGVDLFFVLSGFLITSLLIEARKRPSYYHDFYWKRALRILPLYIVCLLGVLLFVRGSRNYVLLSTFFVSNFALLFHVESSGPFWTLAIEEQFYLLWPTVVRRRSVMELRRWALLIGLAVVFLRFVDAAFGHHSYYFTFFRCDGLAFGAFLACWFYERNTAPANLTREIRIIVLGLLLGIGFFALSQLSATQLRAVALAHAFLQTGYTLFFGSAVAFLINHAGRRSTAIFRSSMLTFFGLISYAMYMTHLYVLDFYDYLRGGLNVGDNPAYALRFFSVLCITIVLCILSRYLIELPAISLRRFVLTRPAPADPTAFLRNH